MNNKVITRFAPSPTGYLHIGGARTALFNYLYSKKNNGKFLLRIEDTDVARSTKEAVDAIINGLKYLHLTPDEEPIFQMQRQSEHIKKAHELLALGKAYKCYCTKEQLESNRLEATKNGKVYTYDRICRNITARVDLPYTIRIKAEMEGSTTVNDLVLGEVCVNNNTLDDFIILRTDGVPTYMFAVVVDDHDMDITHVIRGDDHFTNTFRQYQIYKAFGWSIPKFAHLPLIYSSDGKKLSKRLNAVAIEDYKNMGFLPEAMVNYLMLLGWSYGDNEIISIDEAAKIFNITDVNKSPARFDIQKLESINWHYIKIKDNSELIKLMEEQIESNLLFSKVKNSLIDNYKDYLLKGLESIKIRSKTILELVNNSLFYLTNPKLTPEGIEVIKQQSNLLKQQYELLKLFDNASFTKDYLHNLIKEFAGVNNLKLGEVAKGMRVVLTGELNVAASNFEIMEIFGKEKVLNLLSTAIAI